MTAIQDDVGAHQEQAQVRGLLLDLASFQGCVQPGSALRHAPSAGGDGTAASGVVAAEVHREFTIAS